VPSSTPILERCYELGFALAGVAAAAPTQYERELLRWLEQARHGQMHYLAKHVVQRLDPRRVLPGAKSIICVADRYHDAGPDRSGSASPGPRGRIARYARGDDYHRVMRKRLQRLRDELAEESRDEVFRVCVDTAPVLERELAQRAGLGAVGKHTLMIEPGVGSYLLLAEIITTLELPPSTPSDPDPCGTCTRCIEACPTDAITPWSVDATRCISYLTIEHRGDVDETYHKPMGDWIFGCDICQEVCPHNQPTARSGDAAVHEAYAARREGFDLLEVLNWDEAARRALFVRSAMKRAKLAMMKRNALIAAGNWLSTREHPVLQRRLEATADDPDEDELVRTTARTVVAKLKARSHGGTKARR
jgi:epoxyqueuosine reductase